MYPMVSVEMPDDYLPELPQTEREAFWRDEVGTNVTKMAQACGEQPDTGFPKFDRAWQQLTLERPEKPPETCMYRRKLLRKFYHQLTPILL